MESLTADPTMTDGFDYSTTTDLYGGNFSASVGNADVFAALLGVYLIPMILLGIAVYVYTALAYMNIAKKTNTPNGWLAWIPIANLYLMTQIAKVPWWTMLVVLLSWIPILGPLLTVGVAIWWMWKICENCKKPGWWSLLITFIPIVNLVFIGILAWGKEEK